MRGEGVSQLTKPEWLFEIPALGRLAEREPRIEVSPENSPGHQPKVNHPLL